MLAKLFKEGRNSYMKKIRISLLAALLVLSLLALINLAGCGTKDTTATLGANEQEEIVKTFLQAINDKDAQKAEALLGPDMVYIVKYSDGTKDKFDKREDIQATLTEIIENNTRLTVDEFQHPNTTTLVTLGKASDLLTEIKGFTQEIRYSSKYTFKEGKVSSMEFERNKADEELLQQSTKGTIGIAMDLIDGEMIIQECLSGKPAEKAGLKVGDRIEAIDGLKILEMKYGTKESVYRIRGEEGTKVNLTIKREGKVFDVIVERA